MKAKTEAEHNGDWKRQGEKPMKAKTETEYNGDGKKCMVENQWKQKQKLNITVTEKMHAIKPMNKKSRNWT